jgi:two-component sensor histidine kinase/PAS domain-containing protein
MQVRQRLRLNTLLSVTAALTIMLLLVVALYRINKATKASDLAGQIVIGAFERLAFKNDYIRTNSDRAREQWSVKHKQIGRLIESASGQFRDAKDLKTLNELRRSQDAIKRIFSSIVENRQKAGSYAHPAPLSREVEDRLRVQLNMRVYEVVLHGRNLQESAKAALFNTFRVGGIGILSILILISALTLSNSWAMGRMITARILRLREGASVIGGGNLEHRIDIKGDDEFAELSEAFNAMTSKLSDSYRDLEKEIDERKRIGEAVIQSHKTFSELVERAPFGIYTVDSQFRIAQMNIGSQNDAFRNVRPVIGRDFSEAMRILWPEPVAAEIIAKFRHTLDTGEPYYSRDFIRPRSDVEIVEAYEWELHRMTLPDGEYGVICYYFDSTKLRDAEEAVRESEQKYRNLFENMAEEVHFWQIIRDEEGRIKTWRLVDANPPTLKSWGGRTAEEIRGKTTDEIFGPGATEHYRPVVEKIMTEGIPYSFEDYFPNLGKHFRFTSVPLGDYFITTGADITVIKQAQESLTASLAEKEVLLKEIHHRVKNNMQVISSLVSLQADQLQDAGMRAILDEMAQRVRSMAMVHEKLYQSHDLAGVEFSDYARSLLNYLWRSHATAASAVRLTMDLEPVSLTVNIAVPCGLILNELVSNALKHAFRGRNGGEVTVSLHSAKDGIRLSVRDDGTGLPAGFDWKQTKSLGLRLVQMLAGQLHADVEVSSDRGTEFTILFDKQRT